MAVCLSLLRFFRGAVKVKYRDKYRSGALSRVYLGEHLYVGQAITNVSVLYVHKHADFFRSFVFALIMCIIVYGTNAWVP